MITKSTGTCAVALLATWLFVPAAPRPDQALIAVEWTRSAAERVALCRQTYNIARAQLEAALEDPDWTAATEQVGDRGRDAKPCAVVVDVDETVLDNAEYNARLVADDATYDPKTWSAWVAERNAVAIPGALEYLTHAAARGATVFYVTNRSKDDEGATRDNLRRLGFPLQDADDLDVVLTKGERPEWSDSDKRLRRAKVAETHRIVAMFGDDLGDFLPGVKPTASLRNGDPVDVVRTRGVALASDRATRTDDFAAWWGTRWFVLPNPMYGSWLETWEAVHANADH